VDDALLSQSIVPLDDSHDRRSFSSGVEPLDRYLQVQAGQNQRRRVAAVFVLPDPAQSRIAGYYTLSAFSAAGQALPEGLQKKLPKYGQIPCPLLGRLAVDLAYGGRGVGEHLLVDALQGALLHSNEIASWAVMVDARDDAARRFYSKCGFTALPRPRVACPADGHGCEAVPLTLTGSQRG
jgi:GNAT superfamily N-acetyltransferase